MSLSIDHFPVRLELDVSYPDFTAALSLLSTAQLTVLGLRRSHDVPVADFRNQYRGAAQRETDC
ncbi:hypothetical protein HFO04_36430 [Rhizobium laguerreae]|uniref:hypothetical protein n=1 Tax=Rhizobium laguerreae TaxID=1076926 RepID=UPI001C920772|nr:hypothetical protein [Rhizobium laguerreae]MBY3308175.1 hypothetical protein [Rhizobium laguerreae]MBY3321794.1 hypothetical protein [Rhizobium laguerreae]MBY3363211.1 hypothetical protein [Rhizobium laguerreae]